MKPDTSRWRDQDQYEFYDALPVEGVAWECLRRDETYQDHYQSLVTAGSDADPLPREVEQRWGLRFRRAAISLRCGTERPVVAGCRSGHRASRPTARVSSGRAQRVVRRHGCAAR